jgi:hypothetical protein
LSIDYGFIGVNQQLELEEIQDIVEFFPNYLALFTRPTNLGPFTPKLTPIQSNCNV